MNDNNKGSIRERSKSYRQRVKATAEQSNLENIFVSLVRENNEI